MSAKYPAGPWKRGEQIGNRVDIDAPNRGALCRVVVRMEGRDSNDPEGEANVDAIMAALDGEETK